MPTVEFLQGDCRAVMKSIPAVSVHCCVTSPPYYGLRDYGLPKSKWADDWVGCLGLEPTPAQYVVHMVEVFAEVHRVLRKDGTLWLNLGDSYAGSGRGAGDVHTTNLTNDASRGVAKDLATHPKGSCLPAGFHETARQSGAVGRAWVKPPGGFKSKNLLGIPWRVAFALQAAGWYLREDIIWAKPNCMPESVTDRCTRSHEYIFHFSKQPKYYHDGDAIKEPALYNVESDHGSTTSRKARASENHKSMPTGERNGIRPAGYNNSVDFAGKNSGREKQRGHSRRHDDFNDRWDDMEKSEQCSGMRNKRSVWTVAPANYPEAHFACVDADTEALTPCGWKKHTDMKNEDTIAAYDRNTDSLIWQSASFHRYDYDGEIVIIEKRDSSQRLTPNHRCLVRRRVSGMGIVEAAHLKPGMEILTTATLQPYHKPHHKCVDTSSDFAALLGWYLTEGERKRHHRIRIHQSLSANPEKVSIIRELLNRLRAIFAEHTRTRKWRGHLSVEVTFSIKGPIAELLHNYSPQKMIDLEWINWPEPVIKSLLNAIIDGDGHRRKDGRSSVIQKDIRFLDSLQILALRIGWGACVSRRKDGIHVMYITSGRWLTLRSTNGKHTPLPVGKYKGTVWCPSIPSTFWIARRMGRTFITGNTFPPELIRPCVLAGTPPQGTVLDPFGGSGTTAMVALEFGRSAVLIELNPDYIELARRRCAITPGLNLV